MEFNSEHCHVRYDIANQIVLIQWKKFCCFDDYRAPTLFALELLRNHHGSNLVIDARNGFEDEKEDVAWAFSTLLPAMAQTDCKTVVLIMREVNDIEDEMDLWSAEFEKYFMVRRVASYEQAADYLKFYELLALAKRKAHERQLSSQASAGCVAAALLTDKGNVYLGVCINAQAGMAFCAERAAIAAMVTAGESRIVKLVATGEDDEGACAPCGICREFINAMHDENYKCEVLLNDGSVATIEELLPWRLGTH